MVKNIKKNKKILEYDLIRVIAVIAVLISHCSYYKIANDYGDINFEPNINIMTFSSKFFYIGFKSLSKFLYTFPNKLKLANSTLVSSRA